MAILARVAIIGGGPGGLMLARLLQAGGMAVTVYERDSHALERPQGGSLDLHAQTGQRAMRLAGLESAFMAAARPEDQGDRLYDAEGRLLFARDGSGDGRPEIDRTALRQILLDSLAPGTVHWGRKIETIARGRDHAILVQADGTAERFDAVIGADGAWSRVRPLLSPAAPSYEGVALVEFGFDARRHPRIDALTGAGKMFAAGNGRVLITQRNGAGHIRGYAGWRMAESDAEALARLAHGPLRALAREVFSGWAPALLGIIETGDIIGVRPLYALPPDHGWSPQEGLTLLGDAAHLMSPFSGEGVNLALADAVDLAAALTQGRGWSAVADYEAAMMRRARPAALGAKAGLELAFSPDAAGKLLDHYVARTGAGESGRPA